MTERVSTGIQPGRAWVGSQAMNITVTKHIDAPPHLVFDMLSDFENAPQRVEGIQRVEMLTDGPVGVGTRFRETRTMMKREATEELAITEFDRPRHYAVEADSCGCHFRTDVRVSGESGGSRVEMVTTSRATTLLAKLMTPLGVMMAGTMRKCLEADLDDVKRAAEQEASSPVAGARHG